MNFFKKLFSVLFLFAFIFVVNAQDFPGNPTGGGDYPGIPNTITTELSNDTTPVLGGNLDGAGFDITNVANLTVTGVATLGTIAITGASSGNIKITKPDPSLILDSSVAGDTDFWVGVQDDGSGDDNDFFQIGKTDAPGSTPYFTIDSSGDVYMPGTISGSGFVIDYTDSGLAVDIDSNGTSVVVDNSGNVGIGTTSPAVALDVTGAITASTTITGGTLTDGILSATSGAITGATTGVFGTSVTTPLLIGSTASGGDLTLESTSDSTKGSIFLGANEVSAYDEVNDRLGIGTTSPAYELDVNGVIGATGGTSTIWNTVVDRKYHLNITDVKDSNYSAVVNDYVRCDASTNSFTVTLPEAPVDQSIIKIVLVGAGDGVVEVDTSGSDAFSLTSGSTSKYIDVRNATFEIQYDSAGAFWLIRSTGSPVNFANNFPGIDASTPITEADVSFDTGTLVLTVTPPLGYFNILIDGSGRTTRYRKTGTSTFPAITDTSGYWYFYYDEDGVAVSTQTAWEIEDFPFIASVYRILWNASLVGSEKAVAEYVEYHKNDIPADTHEWMHLYGSVWEGGFTMINNAITSGSPNADGRNTVIGLTSGTIVDDNLDYTVTNSTDLIAWNQDMGSTSAGSLTSANGAKFEIHTQDAGGLQSDLPATRYPFPFSGSDIIEYITSTGVRTEVANLSFVDVFILGSQNPRTGESVEIITSTQDFATLTGARAYTWTDIQTAYPLIGNDTEIRPLYRMIFEKKSIYDIATKYAVLRETQDLRRAAVTSTTASTGSLPASSVTFVPAGDISSTNAQAAIEELDTEKLALAGGTMTGSLVVTADVGIGTTSPAVELDVIGAITASTTITGGTLTDGTFSVASGVITGLVSATDGTASWSSNSLSGFTSISGTTLTDGTLSATAGAITGATTGVFGTSLTTPLLIGSTSVGGNLTLESTSNATKGSIFLGSNEVSAYDEVNDRLGIGTTSPAVSLDVVNGVNLSAVTTETSELGVGIGRSGNGFSVIDMVGDSTYADFGLRVIRFNSGANANSDIVHRGTGTLSFTAQDAGAISLRTTETSRLFIEPGGQVGINDISPASMLEVQSNVGDANDLSIARFLNAGATTAGRFSGIYVGKSAASGGATEIGHNSDTATPANAYSYWNNFGDAQGSGGIAILKGGNVGIGTVSPQSTLHVHNSSSAIRVTDTTTGSTSSDGLQFGVASDDQEAYFLNRENTDMWFSTNGDERMRISNSGNIGIGVSPSLGILHIDKGTGWGQITADGSSGGCLMLRDTDDSGWTECSVLDGAMSCSIDADGVCDGS